MCILEWSYPEQVKGESVTIFGTSLTVEKFLKGQCILRVVKGGEGCRSHVSQRQKKQFYNSRVLKKQLHVFST